MTTDKDQLRLFFALWPDDDVRESFAKYNIKLAQQCTGKPMRASNLHITLAFLGNVAKNRLDCLLPMAKAITFKPFEMTLNHLGIFNSNKIIWAGLEEEPDALMKLATALFKGAIACDIQIDPRPFKPHLTLMRKANSLHEHELELKPVHWQVNDFCLVASVRKLDGVEYKVLNRWPLTIKQS